MSEIAAVCGGEFSGCDTEVRSVTADSRRGLGMDDAPLFVAMRGRNHDGHDFIRDMYSRGVRGFLVEDDVSAGEFPGAGFVRVERSLAGLQALAEHYRKSFRGIMVGITGSTGKTEVKEWIARLVPAEKRVFRSPRSYNSQLGVPLSILMMTGDEDIALIEAGISRPGEMERLASIIRPQIGIFTSLGPEHGENFRSDEHKIREKSSLFAGCSVIVWHDDGDATVRTVLRECAPQAELFDASRYDSSIHGVPAEGGSIRSAALAAGFCEAAGIGAAAVIPMLAGTRPAAMRLDICEGIGSSLVVTDMNNTDINSLPMAIASMKEVSCGRPTTLIMTDVPFSRIPDEELYGKVAAAVRAAGIDRFVGIGGRISACRRLFDDGSEFYAGAEEFLWRFRQDDVESRAILLRGTGDAASVRIQHHLARKSHTTVLEVDLDAMAANLDYYRSKAGPGVRMMAMVKASGYGHGSYEVAETLRLHGVSYLAVAFADEGVRLREHGIMMPIVVLNADSDSFAIMVANRLEPEIYNMRSLRQFVAAVRTAGETSWPIHVKIDTGMHRLGFRIEDIPELLDELGREAGAVTVRSAFSHLAAADMPSEDEFTRGQIDYFRRTTDLLVAGLGYRPFLHIANTAGIERFPEATAFGMCRLGIGLYGVGADGVAGPLRCVSRLTTRIVQIKTLEAGETVGYGRSQRLERTTRLATVPVGYADGLDRRLGNGRWSMNIGGAAAPIVGRVCMDSCMIDVTGIDVAEGDEVTVFGAAAGNTVVDMAAILGTIPYEVMTSVSERVKRIYVKS